MTSPIRSQRFTAVVLLALQLSMPAILPLQQAAASPQVQAQSDAAPTPQVSSPASALAQTPLYFEANEGQTDPEVRFLVRGAGAPTFITDNELVAVLPAARPEQTSARRGVAPSAPSEVVRMRLDGAAPHPAAEGLDELSSFSAYFLGNNPSQWRGRVAHYGQVRFTDVYPDIDLVYHGVRGQLEYDFIVQPGADPDRIALQFEGVTSTRTDAGGDLILATGLGEIRQRRPKVYQSVGDRVLEVPASFKVRGTSVGFEVAEYDRSRPLVIDPVVTYWIPLGGGGSDRGFGIAVDSTGAAYVVGDTDSNNFPTKRAYQPHQASEEVVGDAFVTKLSPTGGLVWSTYLGGTYGSEVGTAIALESGGTAVHVTGITWSDDFPTAYAYQPHPNGLAGEVFVTKLVFLGSSLTLGYSTYLGGGLRDWGNAIAVNSAGYVAVAGVTESTDFPTLHALKTVMSYNDEDAFVTVFKPQRGAESIGLYYSTYFGGDNTDEGYGLYWDAASGAPELVVVGETYSEDLPQLRGLQKFNGVRGETSHDADAFVARIASGPPPPSAPAPSLVYSTFLGGYGADGARSVHGDASGAIYVVGYSDSGDFPTKNAFQGVNHGGEDAFITKLFYSQGVLGMPFSTYLGSHGDDAANGISADASGHYVSVVLSADSLDLPVIPAGWAPWGGTKSAYVARLGIDAGNHPTIYWSGYLQFTREGYGVAHFQDSKNEHHVYATGYSEYLEDQDAFVIKITQ